MTDTYQPTLDQVIEWAKHAGTIAREGFLGDHDIAFKGSTDLVTEVDFQCEQYLVDSIRAAYPSHSILTEEAGAVNGENTDRWYIDPLDGTINYAHGIPLYVISIAYAREGRVQLGVVYNPSRKECYYAERGKGAWLNGETLSVSGCNDLQQALLATGFPYHSLEKFRHNLRVFAKLTQETQGVRRLGCAALEVCYVGSGRFDGYWEQEINAWDVAAGTLIAEEAGATVTDLTGDPNYFKPPYAILAAAPGIHGQLVALFRQLDQT